MENASPASSDPVTDRIVADTTARVRRPDYAAEVRALLDAARRVIAETGKSRVADIVEAAGLSNDAFYRYFPSKDALVAALVEEGVERLAASTSRRMAEAADPVGKLRCWLDAMLEQTHESRASATQVLLGVSPSATTGIPAGSPVGRQPLAELLREPFAELGSLNPAIDAELVTHAVLSHVSRHIHDGTRCSAAEADHLYRFCLRTASGES